MDCPEPFTLANGRCEFTVPFAVVDEFGHSLDGDWDPKGKHGCQHRDTPEWKAAHRPRKPVAKKKEVVVEEKHEEAAQQEAPVAPVTIAHVGTSEDMAFDLSKVLPANGHISGTAALLGGAAILGGILLKVVPSWLRSRTEMAAKRMELKAKRLELEKQSKKDEQDGNCEARHAACLSAIRALEERVKLVESQADSLAGDVASAKDESAKLALRGGSDADDKQLALLSKRITKLETAAKAKKAK